MIRCRVLVCICVFVSSRYYVCVLVLLSICFRGLWPQLVEHIYIYIYIYIYHVWMHLCMYVIHAYIHAYIYTCSYYFICASEGCGQSSWHIRAARCSALAKVHLLPLKLSLSLSLSHTHTHTRGWLRCICSSAVAVCRMPHALYLYTYTFLMPFAFYLCLGASRPPLPYASCLMSCIFIHFLCLMPFTFV